MYLNFAHMQPLFLISIFFLYLMKFGFLPFEESYQLNRLCMLNKDKDKDKEALFNVAYNVTDNISS